MSTSSTSQRPVLRDELIGRAARLVPVLRERAARTEQLRQIPRETIEDLVASGLVRIGNPDRYGGLGADVDTAHEVGWELARGCGSTGWCYSLWTVHNWWLGHFPEQAQEEFFASGPDTFFSSGLNPAGGKAEPVRIRTAPAMATRLDGSSTGVSAIACRCDA
jgi:3-hydroxy-9,10-secoandrosta-1,3,5(10)-triene-9,17-dione monooxygenase